MAERLRDFLVEWRIGAAEADLPGSAGRVPARREAEWSATEAAPQRPDEDGDPLRPFQRAAAEGRMALAASSATHAVLPLLATRPGLRLQLETASIRRIAGALAGRGHLAARVRLHAGPGRRLAEARA